MIYALSLISIFLVFTTVILWRKLLHEKERSASLLADRKEDNQKFGEFQKEIEEQIKDLRIKADEQVEYPIRSYLGRIHWNDHEREWKAHAHPLKVIDISIQLIKPSQVEQDLPFLLEKVQERIIKGDIAGEMSDDDEGYKFSITNSDNSIFNEDNR
jgi:hypothetical protein